MNEMIQAAIAALLGSGVGGGGVAILAKFALDRAARRWDAMEAELKSLRDEKIAGLSGRLEAIERQQRDCPIHRMLERIDNLLGWTKRIDSKLETLTAVATRDSAAIDAQKTWLSNLDASVQAHVRDREVHSG